MVFVVLGALLTAAIAAWPAVYAMGIKRGRRVELAHSIADRAVRKALGGDRFEPASLMHMECGGGEWSKWEAAKIVQREPVTTRVGQILRTVEIDGQTRTCDQCGFAEVRKITVSS